MFISITVASDRAASAYSRPSPTVTTTGSIAAMFGLLVALAILQAGFAEAANQHTYVSNWSSRDIRATITYIIGGTSAIMPERGVRRGKFDNRLIAPQTWQRDEYNRRYGINDRVHIELWVEGAVVHNHVEVWNDRSIVAYDNPNEGVDIFLATYGTRVEKENFLGVTIYP